MTNSLQVPKNNISSLCKLGSSIITNLDMSHMRRDMLNLCILSLTENWMFLSFNAVPGPVTSLQVRPSTTIFGLIISWGPPSGSNYPTPVTYQLRYRERPSSGSPGGWSSTVQMTATQRQYTTPALKPGTRYEVEVWAISSIGNGQNSAGLSFTYQGTCACSFINAKLLNVLSCYLVPGPVISLQVRPSTTIFGLIITWGPPSGSNYPTPVTYQLRYRERPSSGSPGGWSSTVQRTATQRQYTTPVLKPGTRYEVEVWAFVSSRVGTVNIMFDTTGGLEMLVCLVFHHY